MQSGYFAYLEGLASLSGVQNDPRIRRMMHKAYEMKDRDSDYNIVVEKRLLRLAELQPTPFPRPPKGALDGKLKIGRNKWGGQFGLKRLERLSPAILLGRTQTGKSTLIARQITEIIEKFPTPVLAFEPKNSLSGLIREHRNLYVLKLNRIKFNPLAISLKNEKYRKNWISDFWGVLTQTGSLLTGSKSFGFKVLDKLLEEFDSENREPTVFDLRDKVIEYKSNLPASSQTYRYAERVLNRIEGLLFTFDYTFDCQRGFPIEEFLNPKSHLILSWSGLDPDLAKSVCIMLLQAIYHHQLTHQDNNNGITVFIDEAEEFLGFDSYDRSKGGVPFISKLIERGKELGFKALVFAAHHTNLNPSLRENATSRFYFNLSSHEDIRRAAEDMGLNKDQADEIEKLEVGEIVAKVKGREWKEPFTATVEQVPLPGVSESEIKEHNKEFMEKVNEEIIPREETEKNTKSSEKEEEIDLSMDQNTLLVNIAKFPFLSITDRRKKLGWGSNKITKVSGELRNAGLIRKRKLKTSGRGRARVIYGLTDKSLNYLKEKGVEPKQSEGRGGVLHLYWVTRIKEFLTNKGYDTRKEVRLNDIYVDLLAISKKGTRLAVEVEVTDPEHTITKLPDLLTQVDKVVVVCDKKALVRKSKEKIKELEIDQNSVEIRKAQDMDLDV